MPQQVVDEARARVEEAESRADTLADFRNLVDPYDIHLSEYAPDPRDLHIDKARRAHRGQTARRLKRGANAKKRRRS